jgi:hypothetical protein
MTMRWATKMVPALAFVAAVCATEAQAANESGDDPRIYGGDLVEPCAWPSVINIPPGCTGTLIHPEIVIFAQHCGPVSSIKFGEDRDNPERVVPVTCHLNPGGNFDVGPYDYAYCKLTEPVYDVEFTPPAMGCELDLLEEGADVQIVGFGQYDDMTAGLKREATVSVQKLNWALGYMHVGGPGQTVCYGDSGGPTFLRMPDGSWRHVGIHSGIIGGCGNGVGYDVLSKNAIPWIEEHSGIDVTPCTDADGNWEPGPDCTGFPLASEVGGGTWAQGCATGNLTGLVETCGPGYGSPPDDTPPSVTITNPGDETYFEDSPVGIDITLDAHDGEGWGITKLWLRINGEDQTIEDESAPWQFSNVTFPKGDYEIVGVAEDWYGHVAESEPVTIYVGQAAPGDEGGEDGGDDDSGDEGGGDDDGGGTTGEDPDSDPPLDPDDSEPSGCGCAASTSTPAGWSLLPLLLLFRRRRAATALALGLTACSVGNGGEDGFGTDADESSDDDAADATSDSDGSAEGGTDDAPKYDVGGMPDVGEQTGCTKIDFLFVIDNSGSMQDEQDNLIASFPGFISEIQDVVMAHDYHLMVTDTDVAVSGDMLGQTMGDICDPHPACCAQTCLSHDTCNGVPCDQLADCDFVLGAGQVKNKDGDLCGIDEGARYMADGQTDIAGTFACVAEVGTHGNGNEKPMQAIEMALSEDLGGDEACNAGFLRDDALLVVTYITDEEDNGSAGTPDSWRQALVEAKNGDDTAMVVLGLVADGDLPNGTCPGPVGAPTLRSWTETFEYGSWHSVCEPNYAGYFADAVSVVDEACNEFDPAG